MKANSTREKILYSMFNHIVKYGYDNTALSMIADDLEIKKASIYYHFKSKEEIYTTIMKELILESYIEVFDFNVTKNRYVEELLKYGTKSLDIFRNSDEYIQVITDFYIQSQRIESIKALINEVLKKDEEEMLAILNKGIELKIFSESFNIETESEFLLNVIQGLETNIAFNIKRDNNKIWRDAVMKMMKLNEVQI